jgi:hypothetical protein
MDATTNELLDAHIAKRKRQNVQRVLRCRASQACQEERPASYLRLMTHIFIKMQKAQLRFPGDDAIGTGDSVFRFGRPPFSLPRARRMSFTPIEARLSDIEPRFVCRA